MNFQDSLYGTIKLPDWLIPFIKSPEFLRLRGIRLSNVDSFQFKDFNTPTRWEHCISVAYLAGIFAHHAQLDESEKVHLILAALFHDIATPPFAHTMEYVLNDFDHELESYKVLSYKDSHNINHAFPVFASQLPRFSKISETISKQIGIAISTEEVAQLAMGEGKWGFAIKGVLDLDNIDNVTRAAMYMGIDVNRDTPIQLVKWLAIHKCAPKNIKQEENVFVKEWLGYRYNMYRYFYNSSDEEL
jgi:HD superfamily phosphohydrolase